MDQMLLPVLRFRFRFGKLSETNFTKRWVICCWGLQGEGVSSGHWRRFADIQGRKRGHVGTREQPRHGPLYDHGGSQGLDGSEMGILSWMRQLQIQVLKQYSKQRDTTKGLDILLCKYRVIRRWGHRFVTCYLTLLASLRTQVLWI